MAPLGSSSVEQFLRRHWQRRPLLIRQAFPGFAAPIDRRRLFDLAARDDVESRLVVSEGERWSLDHGPFARRALPSLRRPQWTMLVQGVDLHDDAVKALLSRFRFVPDARLDDLMISFATDGGGVGPHLDSYDVFLIQAHGRRRWRIGPARDRTLVPDVPLKILANFEPTEEWVLDPGDMLYLPPDWAHEGVALGECMTFSVGFRAPSRHEFLSAWLAECADAPGGPDPRYGDRGAPASATPARIPDALAQTLKDWATAFRPDDRQLSRFIGRYLTEPKPSVWFETPEDDDPDRFREAATRLGLRPARSTRLLYRGSDLFINGEHDPCTATALLRRFADGQVLTPAHLGSRSADAKSLDALWRWWCSGWIVFDTDAG